MTEELDQLMDLLPSSLDTATLAKVYDHLTNVVEIDLIPPKGIDIIIEYQRRARAGFERGEKPTKGVIKEKIDLEKLGLIRKPTQVLRRL